MAIISANQLETPSISIKSIVPINQRVNRMKVHQKRIRGILQIFLFLQKKCPIFRWTFQFAAQSRDYNERAPELFGKIIGHFRRRK